METIHLFMPLLAELGGFGGELCYKQVAPNGALALQRPLFHKAAESPCSVISGKLTPQQ